MTLFTANDNNLHDESTTTTATADKNQQQQPLLSRRQQKLQKLQKLQRLLVPHCLPHLFYLLGLTWTFLHPLASLITGEMKCRGQFIDENGLDVHRHRVVGYPLDRLSGLIGLSGSVDGSMDGLDDIESSMVGSAGLSTEAAVAYENSSTSPNTNTDSGMCHTLQQLHSSSFNTNINTNNDTNTDTNNSKNNNYYISPSVECLRHQATNSITLDIARILPSVGPMIESTEAIVLVVGSSDADVSDATNNNNNDTQTTNTTTKEDWYSKNDFYASFTHLMQRLSSKKDAPWLTKTVFIVSLAPNTNNNDDNDGSDDDVTTPTPDMNMVMDAFLSSYLGSPLALPPNANSPSSNNNNNNKAKPLPPSITHPLLRTVLLLHHIPSPPLSITNPITTVRILPQGTGGRLPNLDLVFATYFSFKSQESGAADGGGGSSSRSIFRGGSDFRMYSPSNNSNIVSGGIEWLEETLFGRNSRINFSNGVRQYGKDLMGLFGFMAGMVIGPHQPHASALLHGIDALTIELRIPTQPLETPTSIHPHYADFARCIEHLLRSISNLHERLHHSIDQYTMPSPSKFVSHGEYIYPAILVALPLVARAAMLALGDLKRFRFQFVGVVMGVVMISSCGIGLLATAVPLMRETSATAFIQGWVSYLVFFVSYASVIWAARWSVSLPRHGSKNSNTTTNNEGVSHNDSDLLDDSQNSLRFIACLLGIYLHAPLLLANYSLGFPSSAFWSPLLAIFVVPPSSPLRSTEKGSFVKSVALLAKCAKVLIFMVSSPPMILVPRIFQSYTPYVLLVYAPLHLILAALWFV